MSKDQAASAEASTVFGRRKFMNTAALAGLAGVVACTDKGASTAPAAASSSAPAPAPAAVAKHAACASVHL